MYSALILGHSFITRLRDNANGTWANLGFAPSELRVHFAAKGGLSLSGLCRPYITDRIKRIRPDVVVIQIGENDADRQSSDGRSLTLARDILSVAQWLVDGFSVRHVVIMQLLHRASARNLPVESYNANIDRVNSEIRAGCEGSCHCSFWQHKGLRAAITTSLAADKVHLNTRGMRKYIYSVRGSVLLAVKRCQQG